MNPNPDSPANARSGRKPRIALLLATGFGLGYIAKGPGTWGSLLGVGVTLYATQLWVLLLAIIRHSDTVAMLPRGPTIVAFLLSPLLLANIVVAVLGVFVAGRVARFLNVHDPQIVVIDEISGQSLTFLLNAVFIALQTNGRASQLTTFWGLERALNWKYLVAGFILFRAFDIWKPFPARQAESLNGGWGIMVDDWIAAIYAAMALWLFRLLGL
ncbi:MAG TPA: phosphatidylglycerophosphatase A [Candidatus Dormibacteraeota bacterium]|nr:phosphatidylglycerophosphatase A [Candidatus Dormibacteraeota bacterium]